MGADCKWQGIVREVIKNRQLLHISFFPLLTGTKPKISSLKGKDPSRFFTQMTLHVSSHKRPFTFLHTNLKKETVLEQTCFGWLLIFTFSLNKCYYSCAICCIVQNGRMCTAVVHRRVEHWLVLHVEYC
jgi:hypothetical protein